MKSILLIIPEFGGVSEALKTFLNKNYQTDIISINENRLLKKNKKLRSLITSVYFKLPSFLRNNEWLNKIIYPITLENEFLQREYDYLLVIKGHGIYPGDFIKIRSKVKILYMWDKISRFPLTLDLLAKFDHIYTYDQLDAKKYSLTHLPMYLPLYEGVNIRNEKEFYISFIGEYTHHRLLIIKKVQDYCIKNELTSFLKLMDIDQKTNNGDSIITNQKIEHKTFVDVISKSQYTLDLSRNGEYCITERSSYAAYFGIPLIHEGNGDLVKFFNNPKLILPPNHNVYDINEWSNFILS